MLTLKLNHGCHLNYDLNSVVISPYLMTGLVNTGVGLIVEQIRQC